MEDRTVELLPVPYFHIVFTLPAAIGDIAYQNKAVIYDVLFKASSEALLTIADDPKHLGARIGITAVLHTWGSAMTHHPHVHMIVPGGGFSSDKSTWIAAKPQFFLPVFVLSKLFRRLMLTKLMAAHAGGKLTFFGSHTHLTDADQFAPLLAPLRKTRWFVYAKRPFAGPKAADPRPAHRLPPHPPLRLPGQLRQGRQPGQGARTAGSARTAGHQCWRRSHARQNLPLLRRPDARHRDLRAGSGATLSGLAKAGSHQDRHVMTEQLRRRMAIVLDAGPSAGARQVRADVAIDRRMLPAELLAGMRTQVPMPIRTSTRLPTALPASRLPSSHTSPAAKSP
jgi:Putative transposase